MISYNLWRYMVGFAHKQDQEQKTQNTNYVSRLKLLFLAAKIVSGGNRVRILYLNHLSGKDRLDQLITNLDTLRKTPGILNSPLLWDYRFQPTMQIISRMKKAA